MKIYTKTGDSGVTSILGGKRVYKDCVEMEVIGELDELNAAVGVISALLNDQIVVREKVFKIQNDLFVIGSNMAAIQTDLVDVPKIKDSDVEYVENWIDEMDKELDELHQFILPTGNLVAAQTFLARAICRRAERQLIALSKSYEIDDLIKRYLNRLSDLLFTLARWLNQKSGVGDIKWKKE